MDNSPIPNHITRKTAAERCKRAERSLQRYWSKAIEHRDLAVLKYLKLRTEDGEVTDGPEVTKELIDDLKNQGRNPTWFAQSAWVERTYGPRLTPVHEAEPVRVDPSFARQEGLPPGPQSAADAEVVSILKEQLRRSQEAHHEDKRAFREQIAMLKEMFDTLKEDHSDTKELLREVHKVFGSVSQAYLIPAKRPQQESPHVSRSAEAVPGEGVIDIRTGDVPEKGIGEEPNPPVSTVKTPAAQTATRAEKRRKHVTQRQPKNVSRKTPAAKPQPPKEQRPRPKWYQMPTIQRLFSRPGK